MSESQKLQRVLAAAGILALLLILAMRLGWAQSIVGATVKAPDTSSWIAHCVEMSVSTDKDSTITKATVTASRVAVLATVDKVPIWTQCHVIGQRDGTWYACDGPTKLREQMAKTCKWVGSWKAVAGLDSKVRDWLAPRSTCCGKSSLGRSWPCSWAKVTVERLDGYGPGVVGSADPCAEYPVDEKEIER